MNGIEDRVTSLLTWGLPLGALAFCASLVLAWSVSYTHLRAHETRHDLVCRLLLEKKKKKKKKENNEQITKHNYKKNNSSTKEK